MAITITTPSQIDTIINTIGNFINAKIITLTADYILRTKDKRTLLSFELSNSAFRLFQIEGILLFFKHRHGIKEPIIFDYYIVKSGITPPQAFQNWASVQIEMKDRNPILFVNDHLAYYFDLNTNLFSQFTLPSMSLVSVTFP